MIKRTTWMLLLAIGIVAGWARGQQPAGEVDRAKLQAIVVATVNDRPILLGEVDQTLLGAMQGRHVPESTLPLLRAKVLDELIDRKLVEAAAQQSGEEITPSEMAAEREKLVQRLKGRGQTLESLIQANGGNSKAIDAGLRTNAQMTKLIQSRMTAERMEEYFQKHHRRYDGSQARVSHLLIRSAEPLKADTMSRLAARAEEVRNRIKSGELTFAQATEKYSAGPSRFRGGDLGFLGPDTVGSEAFGKVALDLEPGDVSEPVLTEAGVHLVTCSEIRPGTKTFTEVAPAVQSDLAQQVLRELAAEAREKAKVEFTGAIAHFRPGTQELVPAGEAAESATPAP
jgi:parvulin-like peptidyl-prolyl isomerase